MDRVKPAVRKRRRPALSCVECRRRKSKCDRNKPCSQCVQSGYLRCHYNADAASPVPGGCLEDGGALSNMSSNPSQPTHDPSVATPAANNANLVPNELPATWNGVPSVPDADNAVSTMTLLKQRVQELEQRLQEANSIQMNGQIPHRSLPAPPRRAMVSPSLFGRGGWRNAFIFDTVAGLENSICDETSDVYRLLDQCRKMVRKLKAEHYHHTPMPLHFGDCIPPQKIADKIVQIYFRTSEPIFRVLHFPTFHQEYIQHWNDPNASSTSFKIKLLLVIAIGSHFHPNRENIASVRSSTSKWIYAAQSWLGVPSEESRLNITCLQIHCLLMIARQTNAVGGDLTWISAGSLLRHAMNIGLHRDPSHFPNMSIMNAELRRRLWATILEILVQSSLDSSMPPLISYDDFDCRPPSNVDDPQIYKAMNAPPVARPKEFFTQCTIQLALMESLPVRLEIAKLINDFRTDMSYEDTIRLGTKISSACRENSFLFQSFMRPSIATNQAQPTVFQAEYADMLVRRCLIPLHRSFAVSAISSPTYYFSRKICMETALVLLSKDSFKPPPHGSANDFDDPKLLLLGSGLFKSTFVHCIFAICFELITQLQEQPSTSGIASSLVDSLTRKELCRVLREATHVAICRLQDSEASAKQHLFLSCVQAQVDAMQAGEPPEYKILDAARQSLDFCARLLQHRVQRMEMREVESPDSEEQNGSDMSKDDDGAGYNGLMQDAASDYERPDSWLFSGWESLGSL